MHFLLKLRIRSLKPVVNWLFTLLSLVAILVCAKQMPPPGGPVDTVAPTIERIQPEAGAIHVPTRTAIEIVFSERMNKKSVENAIFISPLPSEELRFHWRGKRLRIGFGDTLKSNRTYVFTIGAKAADLRNNALKESFSMAFSTGDRIDDRQITGSVFATSTPEGTLVAAYVLMDSAVVEPERALADYFTQCNQQGRYQLLYLAPGHYRLLAIRDRDGNRKYTRGIDGLGIATTDVLLTDDQKVVHNVNFQLTVEDTIPLMIKTVTSLHRSAVMVRFNDEVADFDETSPQRYFRISAEPPPHDSLRVTGCYKSTADPASVYLLTAEQQAIGYQLGVNQLTDKFRNPLDSLHRTMSFAGNASPDTLPPAIVSISIKDSSRSLPLDQTMAMVFSEPIQRLAFERGFRLVEKNGPALLGSFHWQNPAAVQFQPDSLLKSLKEYFLIINPDSVIDLAGNHSRAATDTILFRTLNEDTLSAIRGEIIDQQPEATGKIFMTARSGQNSYQLVLNQPGEFLFDNILPGIYLINGFRDADSNGVYSYWQLHPFIPAERFFFYADSIKVRSRWPNEGNKIILK